MFRSTALFLLFCLIVPAVFLTIPGCAAQLPPNPTTQQIIDARTQNIFAAATARRTFDLITTEISYLEARGVLNDANRKNIDDLEDQIKPILDELDVAAEGDPRNFATLIRNEAIKQIALTVEVRFLEMLLPLPVSSPQEAPANESLSLRKPQSPPPAPSPKTITLPANCNLDTVNLNQANTTFILQGQRNTITKPQTVAQPGVTLRGSSPTTRPLVTAAVKWKEAQISLTPAASPFTLENVTLAGHDGAEFLRGNNTTNTTLRNVNTQLSSSQGGITPITTNSSVGLLLDRVVTVATGRYSAYLGDANRKGNVRFTIRDCDFGPCRIMDPSAKGRGLSEHPLRIYGAQDGQIQSCKFHNPDNKDGKQAIKIMEGDGVIVSDTLVDGSSRNGRDVNDPSSYKLSNVVYRNCTFTDWVRIDPGAHIAIFASVIKAHTSGFAISVMSDGRLYLQDVAASYVNPAGKLVNSPSKLTVGPGNTFNGKPQQ